MNNRIVLLAAILATASLAGCVEDTGSASPTTSSGLTPGSNEQAYYDDGCVAGTQDGKASMSSVYQRYSDQYDTRFEPYFRQGYEACWAANR
ncbi:hypothetical protein [Aliiruegeria lutimaris]|uniref:Lipoprotein n=1 Tax=Aliiruegeria lutimaris TaxID=571298 RepID=A0A1G9LF47_9RHOB|nr:hypothetical protein [Aliiruegeria lutimaris]SDL60582.1 hypothetical protein SAMN04488026_109710 [Aliiruegeria lutimaris]